MDNKEAYIMGFKAGYDFKSTVGEVMGKMNALVGEIKKRKTNKKRYKGPKWTVEEDHILLNNRDKTARELMSILPNRNEGAINSRRGALKIKRVYKKDEYDGLANLGQVIEEN